jgi:hypothetical protein
MNVRLPLMVSVPGELPGESVPPLITVVGTTPEPPSVLPAATVTPDDAAIEPFTISEPALTSVAPSYWFVPFRVKLPVPTLVREPSPIALPMVPLKTVLVLFAPVVSTAPGPRITLVSASPASEPIRWSNTVSNCEPARPG